METKKQTAVEWLVEKLREQQFITESQVFIAKEMEKENMIKFANDFLFHDDTNLTAEQYYNEHYGN